MLTAGYLSSFSSELKILTVFFLFTLSVGFYLGLGFVDHTTQSEPRGIVENYNGNEDNPQAATMKFKKSDHEMLNILHTHFLSLSVIFFILGLLCWGTNIHPTIRKVLMLEPLLSVVLTFGGIYFLWSGLEWMVYVVMVSGVLMTLSYTLSVLFILRALLKKNAY